MRLVTSADQVRNVCKILRRAAPRDSIKDIAKELNDIKQALKDQALYAIYNGDWVMFFCRWGHTAMREVPHFDPDKMAEILLQKGAAYGDTPIRSWGPIGVAVRCDSKVQRFLHLSEHPDLPTYDETMTDTLYDLVGYCVLGYLLLKEGHASAGIIT